MEQLRADLREATDRVLAPRPTWKTTASEPAASSKRNGATPTCLSCETCCLWSTTSNGRSPPPKNRPTPADCSMASGWWPAVSRRRWPGTIASASSLCNHPFDPGRPRSDRPAAGRRRSAPHGGGRRPGRLSALRPCRAAAQVVVSTLPSQRWTAEPVNPAAEVERPKLLHEHLMPTYDYLCDACGHKFEHFQSISDKLLKKCPKCKKSKLRRLFGTGAAVVFKGSGFYQTDYRSDAYKKAAQADKSAERGQEWRWQRQRRERRWRQNQRNRSRPPKVIETVSSRSNHLLHDRRQPMRCPTCGKRFEPSKSETLPFCSPACRQVDLNRWLSEEQRLPAGGLDEEREADEQPTVPEEDAARTMPAARVLAARRLRTSRFIDRGSIMPATGPRSAAATSAVRTPHFFQVHRGAAGRLDPADGGPFYCR